MTNPKDPWGQRPEDAPTEHLGHSGAPPEYGQGPSVYPSNEQYDAWTPPPPNATQELPRAENQWGAYESGGYGNQYPTPAQRPVPPGAVPPGMSPGDLPPGPPQPPKRNTGLWIALALGVIALIAVAGVVTGALLGSRDSGSNAAGDTTAPATRTAPVLPPQSGRSTTTGIPGVPGFENLGATMGTINANTGGTLTLDSASGGSVTVHTNDMTQVISLSGAKVSDLPVGDIVMVQGDKNPDGSILAKFIISTALPGGPR
ncbi:DUF5666 domain-containing protein [Nocardia goodfellowii]|uniref:DUF5666 domain-containing protein n=1 Tax=Nocardia goodfellowii TaxID=882446 RepID=A0ABS4QBP9_9NOCA|nr:DUF5666 domain-containing protein [Nocardia goodfellowii]MBP2188528.1 hypothetical protein [Nocardia goodfellowii]